ncbi:MAG: glycosyltransferase family 39 protein, partial [Cyanobacteria bacterium P01_A01_bin.17]
MLRRLRQSHRYHLLLLLASIALGLGLRLINLTDKCLWTDELATLVFSLGHSFLSIPLNQIVTSETLLQLLVPDPGLNLGGVVEHLLGESNHPPLYFLLTHLWLQLFPTPNGLVSLWGARSLSALFGAAAIPAIFGLGYHTFRSLWIAQFAALLMATSPLAIYLAQEARHYTLPILWVMASLACLITAIRALTERRPLAFWVMLVWITVNGLGTASHYFFSLALCAEGLVLIGLAAQYIQPQALSTGKPPQANRSLWLKHPLRSTWLRIGVVGAGTLASLVVWLPFLHGVQDSEITQWIHRGNRVGLEWLDPILQLL